MSFYPEDSYYSRSKGSHPVSLDGARYDNFSSNSLASPRYVSRPPTSYSSSSLIDQRTGGNLWRADRFSGSIASSNLIKNSHIDTYQSLPSGFKVNSGTYQPRYVCVRNSRGNVYEARQTGNKIGLNIKSRSQYDLSSTLSEGHYHRHDRYDDDDDDEDSVNIVTGRWNDDYVRRQRNGTLITGPCAGLFNLGNTCFMNSILQCLASTRPIVAYFFSKGYQKDITKGRCNLVSAFAEVIYSMWNTHRAFAPDNFRYEIGLSAKAFAGYSQHDAQEFLSDLLQRLSEDLNRSSMKPETNHSKNINHMSDSEKSEQLWRDYLKTENSVITDLFMGQLRSQLKCCECSSTSNTFDPCLGLSLPIKKSYGFQETTLLDCFELYSQEEKLDGSERTLCENCKKKQKTNKRLSIEKFPRILVLHLKRFSKSRFGHSKLTAKVRCPLTLELSQFSSSEKPNGSVVYDLFAVCNHTGTVSSGHYTATTKSRHTGQWYLYDDERVSFIPNTMPLASDEAYILFYELCTTQRSEL